MKLTIDTTNYLITVHGTETVLGLFSWIEKHLGETDKWKIKVDQKGEFSDMVRKLKDKELDNHKPWPYEKPLVMYDNTKPSNILHSFEYLPNTKSSK